MVSRTSVSSCVIFFGSSLGFLVVGGVSFSQLRNELDWDIGAWYQLYYGAFLFASLSFGNGFITSLILKAEHTQRYEDLKNRVKTYSLVLWTSFAWLCVGWVFVGGFIRNAHVFEDCEEINGNKTVAKSNKEICLRDYNGITFACIVLFVFFFLNLLRSCGSGTEQMVNTNMRRYTQQSEDVNRRVVSASAYNQTDITIPVVTSGCSSNEWTLGNTPDESRSSSLWKPPPSYDEVMNQNTEFRRH